MLLCDDFFVDDDWWWFCRLAPSLAALHPWKFVPSYPILKMAFVRHFLVCDFCCSLLIELLLSLLSMDWSDSDDDDVR